MTDNRVFVTGRSALTAVGTTAEETWTAICNGQNGIGEIQAFDLEQWPCRLAGELKEFQPGKMLPDRKLAKAVSRHDVLGINAAVQAVEHSEMLTYRDSLSASERFNDRTAIYVGSPGNKYFQQYDFLPLLAKTQGDMQLFAKELFNEVHPMWLLRILPNNVLAYTGITYGFKGPNHNITNHATSGSQAILEAYHAIKNGSVDRAVVVAYDVGVEPQAMFYYDKLGVLSSRHLKPFDKDHDGTILADGAAALILESESSVRQRSAVCYAEMVGGASATEGMGLFSIESDGKQLSQLIHHSFNIAAVDSQDIGLIVAHGNGNAKSDDSEALAIKHVFQQPIPTTAFKWSMGHTMTASGLLDVVLATYVLQTQSIPGIANLVQPANNCEGLLIDAKHQQLNKEHAVVINRGFAGMNTCLVLRACE